MPVRRSKVSSGQGSCRGERYVERVNDIESRIDTSRPHTARIWNYWTGGKDNYPVDRAAGDEIRELHPGIGAYAKADRLFLGRAVRHLAEREGITQFLDIGTGLPSADNTHEVAQRVAPDARVVYVDNDPLVLAHAQALLVGTPRAAPTTWTPTCGTSTRSWPRRRRPSTSRSRWR